VVKQEKINEKTKRFWVCSSALANFKKLAFNGGTIVTQWLGKKK
jgi:hypothetical protein